VSSDIERRWLMVLVLGAACSPASEVIPLTAAPSVDGGAAEMSAENEQQRCGEAVKPESVEARTSGLLRDRSETCPRLPELVLEDPWVEANASLGRFSIVFPDRVEGVSPEPTVVDSVALTVRVGSEGSAYSTFSANRMILNCSSTSRFLRTAMLRDGPGRAAQAGYHPALLWFETNRGRLCPRLREEHLSLPPIYDEREVPPHHELDRTTASWLSRRGWGVDCRTEEPRALSFDEILEIVIVVPAHAEAPCWLDMNRGFDQPVPDGFAVYRLRLEDYPVAQQVLEVIYP
jgi:hypothetical protein